MSKHEIFDEAGYLARRARNEARLTDAGVYGPQMEHDACGVGFVAARDATARSDRLAVADRYQGENMKRPTKRPTVCEQHVNCQQ